MAGGASIGWIGACAASIQATRRFAVRDDATGAGAQFLQICILPPLSGDAAISVACVRPDRCKSSLGPASPVVTAFFRARLVPVWVIVTRTYVTTVNSTLRSHRR